MLTREAMLRLVREPANPHDKRAVAVYIGLHKLGYLPRVGNTAAYLMDGGHTLFACITRLRESRNPWGWVKMEVLLEQKT